MPSHINATSINAIKSSIKSPISTDIDASTCRRSHSSARSAVSPSLPPPTSSNTSRCTSRTKKNGRNTCVRSRAVTRSIYTCVISKNINKNMRILWGIASDKRNPIFQLSRFLLGTAPLGSSTKGPKITANTSSLTERSNLPSTTLLNCSAVF